MPRNFPNWLQAYMQHTRDTEAPDVFHFWTGVWTIAGALRRRVWINMRKFQWTPNFYIILVGPAGIVTKSTTTRAGEHILRKVAEASVLDPAFRINFGPQSATWQSITKSLEEAQENFHVGADRHDMSAISMSITELGTLLKMEDRVLGDVMTSLWDGQLEVWGHDTRTTGKIAVKNPWLNIIGCTTPSWMQNNFPEQLIGGGLTSRIVFVFGEIKRQLIPYPDEIIPTTEYYAHEKKLVDDLKDIALLAGNFILTPPARDWGRDWYTRLWTSRPLHMASDRYSGYIARKQTHIHKLAIVLAAAKRSDMTIQKEELEEADAILTEVEPHMTRVFESVGMVDDAKNVAQIMTFVRAYGWINLDDLYRMVWNTMSKADYIRAVQNAREGELIRAVEKEGRRGVSPVQRTVN